jgi:nucleobase:cation symporter-1, NCS1 family
LSVGDPCQVRPSLILVSSISRWLNWRFTRSAQGFLSFVNGYTVFLGPFAGIMISDYYIVHKCRVDVPAMYNPNGRYKYSFGIVSPVQQESPRKLYSHSPLAFIIQNWRAALALVVAVPPLLPGLINSINPKVPIGGASHLFNVAWLFGFFVASGVYTAASLVFPAKETFLTDEEVRGLRGEHVDEVEDEDEKEKGKPEGVEKVF